MTTFLDLVVMSMVPYVLASQGTMLSGRAGVFNVAQEGIMLLGASVAFVAAWLFGGLLYGALLAAVVGALVGLALAYFTTNLKMDQFVIGLALFFVGLGLASFIHELAVGVTLTPPLIPTLRDVAIPGLASLPVIGPALFHQNLLVYFAIAVTLLLYYVLYRRPVGLDLRAVGENPMAADGAGVSVPVMRYTTTALGSALIGLAGAYLPMVYTGTFTEGMVAGRGWIAIALTFVGGWRPHLIFLGSLFFATVEVLAFRVQIGGTGVAYHFLLMLPYVATILVMVVAYRRLRAPDALGRNYDRESRVAT